MNFIEFESAEKLRGGFYTDKRIAAFLVRWIASIEPRSILEPSCGDGVFFEVIENQNIESLERVSGYEINEIEAQKARERSHLPVNVTSSDFLHWFLLEGMANNQFDAIIGNPPFIRYQYLPDTQQALAEEIFRRLKLPFTRHTNAWVPFVLASLRLLRPGGRLAMVIPSEIFHIPHAQSLRRYLTEVCSRILILDPEEIWFGETLQGTVLLLAEKKQDQTERTQGVAVIPVNNRLMLDAEPDSYFSKATYSNGSSLVGKWMPLFLSSGERFLLDQLKENHNIKKFAEIATVDVGIVTGANKFFLVPDSIVEKHSLEHWAHPMFGRSYHVRGIIYSQNDHLENKLADLPTNFLWFKEENGELTKKAQEYLDTGIAQKLHTRYKCRNRTPWYLVPSVYKTPIGMLKRANDYPRLILNEADTFTTDTAYRIRPIGIEPVSLVANFLNSLTCLSAELEGRHYGGGVLELVPSEIERLLIPVIETSRRDLDEADRLFRDSNNHIEFLRQRDRITLAGIGLSTSERESLHAAWLRLRNRRRRIASEENLNEHGADS